MSILKQGNPNPSISTRFKRGHAVTSIGDKRTQITKSMLKCVKLQDVKDFMAELLRLVKTPGRGELKAMEIFLKLCCTLPKQEIETIIASTPVATSVDIMELISRDNRTN